MQPSVGNNKCIFIASVIKKTHYFLVDTKGKKECKSKPIIFSSNLIVLEYF